jgi:PAS domain S-box-containing protein
MITFLLRGPVEYPESPLQNTSPAFQAAIRWFLELIGHPWTVFDYPVIYLVPINLSPVSFPINKFVKDTGISQNRRELTAASWFTVPGSVHLSFLFADLFYLNRFDMISVLYVDDECSLLEIAKIYLERTGDLEVSIAESARKGLDLLGYKKFDAVISDYQMPEMDGLGFLKEVRREYGTLPFILFTGKGREEVVIEAINNGVDFYLQKGGDPRAQFTELRHKVIQAVTRRQAESSLIESRKRLSDIIDFLPDATFAIDMDGVVIAWNKAIEKMTNVKSEDIVGKGDYEYAIPFYLERRPILIDLVIWDDPSTAARYPVIKREGHKLISEITLSHFNNGQGASFWFTASPLYDVGGNTVGAIESIRDITDRKKAEMGLKESESRLRSFVDMTQEGVLLIDEEGKVIEWNPGSERISGLPKEEVLGRYWWDAMFRVIPKENRDEQRKASLEAMIKNALRKGTSPFKEPKIVEIERSDGTRVITRQTVFPIKTENGFRFGSIAQDITEEKRAEDAVRLNEEKYRSIFENSILGIFQTSPEGRLITANQAFATIFGYESPEKMIDGINDITVQLYANPVDRASVMKTLEETGRLESKEVQFIRRDGSLFWMSFTARKVNNPDGTLAYFEGMGIDISEQKEAEDALRESNLRQKAFINASADMAFLKDENLRYLMINDAYRDFFSIAESEILGKTDFDLMPDAMARNCRSTDNEALLKGRLVLNTECVDDRTYETRKFPVLVGRGRGVGGVIRDITDQVMTEKAIRDSEERLRALVETSPDMIWEIDPEGNFRYISPQIMTILGYRPDELTGKSVLALIPEEAHSFAMEEIGKHLKSRVDLFTVEVPARHKDGRDFTIEIRSSPVIDEKGVLTGLRGVAHDITERRRVQADLKKSEELHRVLVNTVPDLAVQTNLEGEITYINDYGVILGGFSSASEAIGTPVFDYFAPEDLPRALENTRLMFERQLGPVGYTFIGKDGRRHDLEINGDVLRNADGKPYGMVYFGRDITTRKKTDLEMKRAYQQLTMLYGITRHDILNNLMVILGNIEVARMGENPADTEALINRIEEKTLQIRSQIEFTRVYEELGSHEPVWHNIHSILSKIPERSGIAVIDETGGTEVFADPILEKVFENLIDNSIRHGEKTTEIRVNIREEDERLAIIYEDNGVGIADDEKPLIFERGYGKNTGLGLFLVREVLALTGMTISETGKPGKGVRFEIIVPPGKFRTG